MLLKLSGKHMVSGILKGPCSTKPSKQRNKKKKLKKKEIYRDGTTNCSVGRQRSDSCLISATTMKFLCGYSVFLRLSFCNSLEYEHDEASETSISMSTHNLFFGSSKEPTKTNSH